MIGVSLWTQGGSFTGGPGGIFGIPVASTAGYTIRPGLPFTLLCDGWLLLVVAFCARLEHAKVAGRCECSGATRTLRRPSGWRQLAEAQAFVIGSNDSRGDWCYMEPVLEWWIRDRSKLT
jgi:hypothetical protein